MQVSKRKVNRALEKQLSSMLYQLVADIKNPVDAELIFKEILSETELVAIIKRLGVSYWLTKKRSYEVIKENIKVSSATIATIQRRLSTPGWKLAINNIVAEEWATKWEKRIKSFLGQNKN